MQKIEETPPLNSVEEYEKIKKELQSKPQGDYNVSYVLRQLQTQDNLRKTFLSAIKFSPARISEISEDALLSKPTCYSQLHKLLELRLIGRIYVMSVMDGTVKNDEIKNKFVQWTSNMPDSLKRYYLAKTSFWVITDYGKQFAVRTSELENQFKKKRGRKENE